MLANRLERRCRLLAAAPPDRSFPETLTRGFSYALDQFPNHRRQARRPHSGCVQGSNVTRSAWAPRIERTEVRPNADPRYRLGRTPLVPLAPGVNPEANGAHQHSFKMPITTTKLSKNNTSRRRYARHERHDDRSRLMNLSWTEVHLGSVTSHEEAAPNRNGPQPTMAPPRSMPWATSKEGPFTSDPAGTDPENMGSAARRVKISGIEGERQAPGNSRGNTGKPAVRARHD